MFLSWKPSGEGSRATHTSLDPITAMRPIPQACASCRARKVKCIWDGGGCERCKASGRECVYEATNTKASISARRRSKEQGSETGTSTKRPKPTARTTADQTAESAMLSPSSSDTSGQTLKRPRRPSETTVEKRRTPSSGSSPLSHTNGECGTTTPKSTRSGQDVATSEPKTPSFDATMIEEALMSLDQETCTDLVPPMDSLLGGDVDLLSMFSTSTPSTAESILNAGAMDTDMHTNTGTLFSPSEETALDISARFGTEDGAPGSTTPPNSMSTHTSVSGYVSKLGPERHVLDSSPCQCLHRLVILVDEIESIVDRNGIKSLDGALAAHKEALGCGAQMLDCLACTSRVENMIILTLMVDKLVSMCSHVAKVCCMGLQAHGGESSTGSDNTPETTPLLSLQSHTNTNRHRLSYQELDRGPTTTTRVYSIDSSDEYLFIVAGILRFQLQQLYNLARKLQEVSAPFASDTMSRRLGKCNEAVQDMLRKAGLVPSKVS